MPKRRSSTRKGNDFERRVHDALADQLNSGVLGVLAANATLFRRKAYYSRDRESLIATDLSIELVLAPSANPVLTWIFECKDCQRALSVNEVEEFHSKVEQIGRDNTKGTIVSSGALQKGALQFARAMGIGVIRLLPDEQLLHLLYSKEHDPRKSDKSGEGLEFLAAFLRANHKSSFDFFGTQDGFFIRNWKSMLAYVFVKEVLAADPSRNPTSRPD